MSRSSKGRYGVRAMLDVAVHEGMGPVSIKSISQREGVSLNYLEQIFNQLRKAGLVKSVRGPGGGFLLSLRAREIKIMDIMKALKEAVTPVYCLDNKEKAHCKYITDCSPRLLWRELGDKIKEVLEKTSLEDLLEKSRKTSSLSQPEHKYIFQI